MAYSKPPCRQKLQRLAMKWAPLHIFQIEYFRSRTQLARTYRNTSQTWGELLIEASAVLGPHLHVFKSLLDAVFLPHAPTSWTNLTETSTPGDNDGDADALRQNTGFAELQNKFVAAATDGNNSLLVQGSQIHNALDGDDFVFGSDSANLIFGGGGDDFIYGNGGSDRLAGGDGTDFIRGGSGDDFIWGGHTASLSQTLSFSNIKSWNDGVTDYLVGGTGFDTYYISADVLPYWNIYDIPLSFFQSILPTLDIIHDEDDTGKVEFYQTFPDWDEYGQPPWAYWVNVRGADDNFYKILLSWGPHWAFVPAFAVKDEGQGAQFLGLTVDDVYDAASGTFIGFQGGPNGNGSGEGAGSGNGGTGSNGSGSHAIEGTTGDDYIGDTAANDIINAGDGDDTVFLGSGGNDTVDGEAGNNHVDLNGAAADYTFGRNANGNVTVSSAATGTDTLMNINGFYFYGEQQWYDLDALAPPTGGASNTITGTAGDDYIVDTDANDVIHGGEGDDTVVLRNAGNDTVDGEAGNNHVDLEGASSDYTYGRDSNGNVTVSSAATGIDTLMNMTGFYFYGEQQWYDLDELAPPAEGTSNTITGTAGDDYIVDTDASDVIHGGDGDDTVVLRNAGNDTVDGEAGNNHVDLEGASSDYTYGRDANGNVTVSSAATGIDTLMNMTGIYFYGEQQWYDLDALAPPPPAPPADQEHDAMAHTAVVPDAHAHA